jgi:hypothetical protein
MPPRGLCIHLIVSRPRGDPQRDEAEERRLYPFEIGTSRTEGLQGD